MSILRRAAFAVLLSTFAAVHAAPAPRAHVDAVADAIQTHYFDPARGARIAQDLRRDAEAGAFDALSEPQALASALTGRLRPLDRHFSVRWNGPGAAATTGARGPRAPAPNHGIAKVETLPGDVGYLRLSEFAHFEPDDERAPPRLAIDDALAALAARRALIIDLRGNRGGSPSMVGYLASAFVAPDADIYNTFRTRARSFSEAPRHPHAHPRTRVPIQVLIDGGTASAAESFAYTLQSAGRATVVGERSAGAANPGGVVEVGQGFSVFVSDGTPVNPITGTNWETTGVTPDLAVASDAALEAALARTRAAH